METMRNFVNSFIAEENEQFSKEEFGKAIVVTIIMCIGLVLACL